MEFIKTNINTADKQQVYRMTKGDSLKVQDLEKGASFPVDLYAVYKEEKTRNKQDGTVETYTDTVLSYSVDGSNIYLLSSSAPVPLNPIIVCSYTDFSLIYFCQYFN